MRIIKKFFHSFVNYETRILGRWNLDHWSTKVDLANEDHCGVCSEYIESRTKPNQEQHALDKRSDEEYEEYIRYMM